MRLQSIALDAFGKNTQVSLHQGMDLGVDARHDSALELTNFRPDLRRARGQHPRHTFSNFGFEFFLEHGIDVRVEQHNCRRANAKLLQLRTQRVDIGIRRSRSDGAVRIHTPADFQDLVPENNRLLLGNMEIERGRKLGATNFKNVPRATRYNQSDVSDLALQDSIQGNCRAVDNAKRNCPEYRIIIQQPSQA